MSNNRHASEESFSRSAGGAAIRGAVILAVALGIGVFLISKTGDHKAPKIATGTPTVTDTTVAEVDPGADPLLTSTTIATLRAPEVVKVLVANGSGVNRAAARVRAFLVPLRYDLPAPADGALSNYQDWVYFNPGFELEAKDIASKLGVTSLPMAVPANVVKPPVPAFDVLVMVGPDLAVRYRTQALTATASTPSTTSAAAAAQ